MSTNDQTIPEAQNTTPDAPEAPEVAEVAEDTTQPTEDTTEAPDAPEDGKAAREAAKYRRQLRQAEKDRDALASQLDAARAQLLAGTLTATHVGDHMQLHDTAHRDVFPNPSDVFTEEGQLDHDKVSAALEAAYAERPHYFHQNRPKPLPLIVPAEGKVPASINTGNTWAEAMKPQHAG